MKRKRIKSKVVQKPSPIVIVPDRTCIDDAGNVILTDIILVVDPTVYTKIRMSLTDATRRETDDKSKSRHH